MTDQPGTQGPLRVGLLALALIIAATLGASLGLIVDFGDEGDESVEESSKDES